MSRRFVIAIAIAAFAAGSLSLPAQARDDARPAVAKKHPAKRHVRSRDDRQIACTMSGCRPIPRNCHPETEYNWFTGEPTGFDAIVCR